MVRIQIGTQVVVETASEEIQLGALPAACVLVVTDADAEGVARDRLIELLWGEPASRKLRGRLRQLIYELNQKVGSTVLRGEGGRVVVGEGVERRLKDSSVQIHVLARTSEMEHWLDAFRDRMSHRVSRGLAARCVLARTSDEPTSVLEMTEHEESEELLHHRLWALFRLGRVGEARQLASTLADLAPSMSSFDGLEVGPTPLVGRTSQMEQVVRVATSRVPVVLLGDAGVGKTRLVDSVVAHLQSLDPEIVVLRVAGRDAIARAAISGVDALIRTSPELSAALSELSLLGSPNQGAPSIRMGPVQEVTGLLREAVRRAFGLLPIVVAIDDLHLIDEASVEILLSLAADPAVDVRLVSASQNRLAGSVPSIVYIPIPHLGIDDSVALLRHLRPYLDDEELDALASAGGGLPGALEALAATVEKGDAARVSLGGAFDAALAAIPTETCDLIRAVAASRHGLPIALLGLMVGRDDTTIARELDDLVRSGMIEISQNLVRVRSRLLLEHLLSGIAPGLARSIAARAASWLLESDGQAGLVGLYWRLAGEQELASEYLMRAAREADQRGAFRDALRFAQEAEAGQSQEPMTRAWFGGVAVRAAAYLEAARALEDLQTGDPVADRMVQIDLVNALIRLDPRSASASILSSLKEESPLRHRAILLDLGITAAEFAVDAGAMSSFTTAIRDLVTDNPDEWIVAWLGTRLVHLGDRDLGFRCALEAVELADPEDAGQIVAAHHRLLSCLSFAGPSACPANWDVMTKAERLASSAVDLHTEFCLLTNRAAFLLHEREYAGALKTLASAEQVLGVLPSDERLHLELNRLEVLIGLQDYRMARDTLSRVRQLLPSPRQIDAALCDSAEALILLAEGRLGEAESLVSAAAWLDLRFPFASDPSLILKARAMVRLERDQASAALQEIDHLRASPLMASDSFRATISEIEMAIGRLLEAP